MTGQHDATKSLLARPIHRKRIYIIIYIHDFYNETTKQHNTTPPDFFQRKGCYYSCFTCTCMYDMKNSSSQYSVTVPEYL